MFRKPKRNVRQRKVSSDEGSEKDEVKENEDTGLEELHSSINKFKEKKKSTKKDRRGGGASSAKPKDDEGKAKLSFEQDLNEGDDGEIFQVKKTSHSRRLMKQLKADKKKEKTGDKKNGDGEAADVLEADKATTAASNDKASDARARANELDPELDITFKDNIQRSSKPSDHWTLTGREAEALHMEEEDEEDGDSSPKSDTSDPLQKLLKSGSIPDAAAIHAARKKREAMREGRAGKNGHPGGGQGRADYIPLRKEGEGGGRKTRRKSGDSDSDEDRIDFAGVRSDRQVMTTQMSALAPTIQDDDDETWERQQIRKAMGQTQASSMTPQLVGMPDPDHMPAEGAINFRGPPGEQIKAPVAYNLQGIKGRLKERLESLKEVNSRHEKDLDRVVDDMVNSQEEVERAERNIPSYVEKHKFYQDLRGYVTDMVDCYNEKLENIKYLEDKYIKSKAEVSKKITERRRDDVRDQMMELSSTAKPPLTMTQEEIIAEESRQRRAAEREGRRRRRQQSRKAGMGGVAAAAGAKHADGMSSDDELSTTDSANASKIRTDVENQARQVMSDVVDDFATLDGVCSRMTEWKKQDRGSYSDAFVYICLPKIFSPLVRLQLLFWNPLVEHASVETMPWYRSLALYGMSALTMEDEEEDSMADDPDRRLLSMVIEKVVVVKVTGFVRSAHDPLSASQTQRLAATVGALVSKYPTVNGDSKQVRELLQTVRDKLKAAIDNDVYIPIGYPKHFLENPLSGHVAFLNRQFWSAFKLYRNILCWHGILSDQVVGEMALGSLLNRYMAIGLGVMADPTDVVNKMKQIVNALPKAWLANNPVVFKMGLDRFARFVKMFAQKNKSYQTDAVKILRAIGAKEEADEVSRQV